MSDLRHYHNIALVGFMGTGKTSVSHILSSLLHFEVLDTDAMIEDQTGKRISEIFEQEGEPRFRAYEKALVEELKNRRNAIISTGGGLVTNPENIASLKTHSLVVCLWASPEVIWERVRHQSHRPLLLQTADPLEKIRTLLEQREPFYREADVLVHTEFRSLKEVAHQILHHWHHLGQ